MIWFGLGLFIIGLVTVIVSVVLLLRSQRQPPPTPRQLHRGTPPTISRTRPNPQKRPVLESTLAHMTWARRELQTDPHIGVVAPAVLLGQKGEQFPVYEGENTLGRHSSNMIQIVDSTVSRYHAVIEGFGEEFVFMDWQASQPSEINGELVTPGEHHALKDGDKIRVGITALRFVVNRRNHA